MAYQPPKQGLVGQVVDVVVLLVHDVGALYLPLYMGLGRRGQDARPDRRTRPGKRSARMPPSSSNGQRSASPTRHPPTTSSPRASTTPSSWTALIIMAVAVVGYFILVVRLSDQGVPRSDRRARSGDRK